MFEKIIKSEKANRIANISAVFFPIVYVLYNFTYFDSFRLKPFVDFLFIYLVIFLVAVILNTFKVPSKNTNTKKIVFTFITRGVFFALVFLVSLVTVTVITAGTGTSIDYSKNCNGMNIVGTFHFKEARTYYIDRGWYLEKILDNSENIIRDDKLEIDLNQAKGKSQNIELLRSCFPKPDSSRLDGQNRIFEERKKDPNCLNITKNQDFSVTCKSSGGGSEVFFALPKQSE